MVGKRFGVFAAFALAASVVACGDEGGGPAPFERGGPSAGGNGGGGSIVIGPDGVPVGPDGEPIPPKLDGKYELSTEIDFTTAGLLPENVNDALKALSNFREKPSQTLVGLMDAANVPIVPNVINAIPSPIRSFFLGYIDDYVFKAVYDKVPVTQRITGVLDDLASIVTRFELVTMLDLPQGDAIGDSEAKHSITGVAWRWDGNRRVINAPDLVSQLVEQQVDANAVLLEKLSPKLESGRLKLGDHTFSVPIGSFAVYAADEMAKDKLGAADLRDAIGKIVDCEKLADNVANRCIDPVGPGKVCVGHKNEVKQFCTVGLDLLVGAVKGAIKQLDIPVLQLKEGVAQMWDAPMPDGPLDATIDRIEKGFWTAFIKLSSEDKPVVATFTGRRVGDTANPSRPSEPLR
jgi:hypothetical protein